MTQRRYHAILSILVILAITCSVSIAKTAKQAVPGISNFHRTTDGIYRGGAPSNTGLKTLKQMGVRTIIDLRGFSAPAKQEKKTAESMGLKWINLPMGSAAPTTTQVSTFLAVLAKAPDEPVFVHCQHGADRTGCMIGIYRVQVQGWSFSKAWAEMRAYGFKPWLSELKNAVKSRAKREHNCGSAYELVSSQSRITYSGTDPW